eukprot:TRINITY_DN5561_c0_g2_i1.p2 TRINITY_DN5561_c0_g2~~TRINITY_DN5561_c0_g2_i1.p2  ORF type:complete len:133 (+),score=44.32 TRINITY_DN5561_c0_g2_i1:669-1067(+)
MHELIFQPLEKARDIRINEEGGEDPPQYDNSTAEATPEGTPEKVESRKRKRSLGNSSINASLDCNITDNDILQDEKEFGISTEEDVFRKRKRRKLDFLAWKEKVLNTDSAPKPKGKLVQPKMDQFLVEDPEE